MQINNASRIICFLIIILIFTSVFLYAQKPPKESQLPNSKKSQESYKKLTDDISDLSNSLQSLDKRINQVEKDKSDISNSLQSLDKRINKVEKDKKEKDIWDIISSISVLLSGVLISGIGGVATYIYRERKIASEEARSEREILVSQISTVRTFFPHLQSKDKREKEAALIAISGMGNPKLAAKLAELYRDEGAIGALVKLSLSSEIEEANLAKITLNNVFYDLLSAVVTLEKNSEFKGIGVLIRSNGLIATTDYMVREFKGTINVKLADDNIVQATTVYVDQKQGVLILKIEGMDFPYIDIDTSPELIGEEITAIGYEKKFGWVAMKGDIDATHVYLKNVGGKDYSGLLSTTLRVKPGFGGCPVINTKGQIIGLIHSRANTRTFLISSYSINNALRTIDRNNRDSEQLNSVNQKDHSAD